jgi:hypothetical protein
MTIWREAAELLVRLGEHGEAIEAYRALADWGGAPEPVWLSAAGRMVSETASNTWQTRRRPAG